MAGYHQIGLPVADGRIRSVHSADREDEQHRQQEQGQKGPADFKPAPPEHLLRLGFTRPAAVAERDEEHQARHDDQDDAHQQQGQDEQVGDGLRPDGMRIESRTSRHSGSFRASPQRRGPTGPKRDTPASSFFSLQAVGEDVSLPLCRQPLGHTHPTGHCGPDEQRPSSHKPLKSRLYPDGNHVTLYAGVCHPAERYLPGRFPSQAPMPLSHAVANDCSGALGDAGQCLLHLHVKVALDLEDVDRDGAVRGPFEMQIGPSVADPQMAHV